MRRIFCAAYGQTGSTAFWNLVKFIYDEENIKYHYFYVHDFKKQKYNYKSIISSDSLKKEYDKDVIIKIHLRQNIKLKRSDIIFFNYRDFYQTHCSAKLKDRNVEETLKRNIKILYDWYDDVDYLIPFDDIVFNKKRLIKYVSKKLGLKLNNKQILNVENLLNNIPTNNYSKYLLRDSHKHGGELGKKHDYKKILNESEINMIKKYEKIYPSFFK